MEHDPRLEWIQANRTRKARVQPVSAAIQRITEQLLRGQDSRAAREVLMIVAGTVDEEFRRRCRVLVESRGTLVVTVDSPALVYPMRLRWAPALHDLLVGARCASPIRRIVFEHGTAGLCIPEHTRGLPAVGLVQGSGRKPWQSGTVS